MQTARDRFGPSSFMHINACTHYVNSGMLFVIIKLLIKYHLKSY